jgi:SAM-dependent methyltransferase
MYWKLKAITANFVDKLPSRYSYECYRLLQRLLGRANRIDVISQLKTGVSIFEKLEKIGYNPSNKMFFELGTGLVPVVPIALYLLGATRVVSVDLNPYMDERLLRMVVKFIKENKEHVKNLLGHRLINDRLDFLTEAYGICDEVGHILDMFQISYLAPQDAKALPLESSSFDVYFSHTVLEHIPVIDLKKILVESKRILKTDGLCLHFIDYHDHFATQDKSISDINFLKYSEKVWKRIVNNRFLYTNRLRHDDFEKIIRESGMEIVYNYPIKKQSISELLRSGFRLDKKYIGKSIDTLETTAAWLAFK